MAAVYCPLRLPPPLTPTIYPQVCFSSGCTSAPTVCLSLHLSVDLSSNTISSSIWERPASPPLSFTLPRPPSNISPPLTPHAFISLLLLLLRVCVCAVVRMSAEWMEPSCRSCQSHCREMRSGCSEDTQHLSGSLQIWALRAGVCACVVGGGVCICLAVCECRLWGWRCVW